MYIINFSLVVRAFIWFIDGYWRMFKDAGSKFYVDVLIISHQIAAIRCCRVLPINIFYITNVRHMLKIKWRMVIFITHLYFPTHDQFIINSRSTPIHYLSWTRYDLFIKLVKKVFHWILFNRLRSYGTTTRPYISSLLHVIVRTGHHWIAHATCMRNVASASFVDHEGIPTLNPILEWVTRGLTIWFCTGVFSIEKEIFFFIRIKNIW